MQDNNPRKRSIDIISPYLLTSCIKNRKWDSVQFYLHQAHLPDERYSYALHLVCQVPSTPLSIVRMIYFAFPDAAVYLNANKCTPLFLAVENQFLKAAEFLSYQNPGAALIRNGYGMTPLQHTLHDLESEQILRVILTSNPMAIQQLGDDGESILESFFVERNCNLRALLDNNAGILFLSELEAKHWAAYSAYSKCILLLKAVTMENLSKSNIDDDEWLALHASCKVDVCPWSFCNLLLQIHPEQAMKLDVDGNLPIHIITSASRMISDEYTIDCDYCRASEKVYYTLNEDNDFTGLCFDCHRAKFRNANISDNCMEPVHKVAKLVEDLVALNSNMAMVPDRGGNYPLDISVSCQQSFSTTKVIFDAAPSIGRKSHPSDRLIPFMYAAVGDWDDEIDQISTIFYLLKEDPVIIKNYTDKPY